MLCKFCGKETKMFDGIYVCDECGTVSFFQKIELAQKKRMIMEYLKDIQEKLLKQRGFLYSIEQRYILRKKLTEEEKEIRDKLNEFQSIRSTLEAYIKRNSQLNEIDERKSLYQLLMLSKWISKYFSK